MAKAKKLLKDPDAPESFDVKGHLMSPLARLAITNGFKRSDRSTSEERYVKKLSDGKEAWLRTSNWISSDPTEPLDHTEAGRGRTWELVIATPYGQVHQYQPLASGTEYTMNALLGAILQRLATWPTHLPKPGEPGSQKLFK